MIKDILFGFIDGVKIISHYYAAMLCFAYAGLHMNKKHAKWYKIALLFIPVAVMCSEYEEYSVLKSAPTPFAVAFFATMIIGCVLCFLVFLDIYDRSENR